jgi:hypothetical protein
MLIRLLILSFVTTALAAAPAAHAKIFHSKESALRLAFPDADEVKPLHLFLDEDQAATVRQRSRTKVPSRLVTVYVGHKAGLPTGFAFIDTHVVRTMPETFLVVLGVRGHVRAVHILAFHEPLEYLPSRSWLQQFKGRALGRGLAVRQEIAGIAGATMSATAVTAGIRRVLAFYDVLLRPSLQLATGPAPNAAGARP